MIRNFSAAPGICHSCLRFFAVVCISFSIADLYAQTISDADGNSYKTVKIGNQVWMSENLRTTKLSDGTGLILANEDKILQSFTPSYSWFNNDETSNRSRYGALYNWYATATKKLCPAGWHVPTDSEWTILADFLEKNGFGYEGNGNDISKSMASRSGWTSSSEPGTTGYDQEKSNNRSGFSALPGGVIYFNGKTDTIGSYGFWWSSTEFYTTNAWSRGILHNKNYLFRFSYGKRTQMSVRCVKN